MSEEKADRKGMSSWDEVAKNLEDASRLLEKSRHLFLSAATNFEELAKIVKER